MFAHKIDIGAHVISLNHPTYFIADIAANHDGDLERAKDLICISKESGADCVKFQHFLAEKIVSDFGFKNLKTTQAHQSSWRKSVFEIYKDYECKRNWNEELVKTCREANIEFMTTPYDYEILEEIDKHVNAYKIGSGDITWLEFIEHIAKLNKPILLATGASDLDEVKTAINIIQNYNSKIILMQCNTNYTASFDNFKYINLNVLNTYHKEFPDIILGLSDHTFGHATVLGSIALGAKVIEKHFTDDNAKTGPDHKFAMNPQSWKEMVERSRELEFALGDGIKRVENNEKETVIVQRRSICLKKDLNKGDILRLEDIDILRPAPTNSYPPYSIHIILNKTLKLDKKKGDSLFRGDFNE